MAEISSQAVCCKQLSQLAEADMISFVDDTIHFLKGNRVPFLSKYQEAFGGQSRLIVPCRDFLQDIMQLVLRKSQATSSVDSFKTTVSDFITQLMEAEAQAMEGLDVKFAEIIAVSVFARRNELVRVLTELIFRQSVD